MVYVRHAFIEDSGSARRVNPYHTPQDGKRLLLVSPESSRSPICERRSNHTLPYPLGETEYLGHCAMHQRSHRKSSNEVYSYST